MNQLIVQMSFGSTRSQVSRSSGSANRARLARARIVAVILTLALLAGTGCDDAEQPIDCAESVGVLVDSPSSEPQIMTTDIAIRLAGRVQMAGKGAFFPTYVTIDNRTNGAARAANSVTTEDPCELAWSMIGTLALDLGVNEIVVVAGTPGGTAEVSVEVTRIEP